MREYSLLREASYVIRNYKDALEPRLLKSPAPHKGSLSSRKASATSRRVRSGREFVAISRWEPTSQVCSDCGYRWGKLDLSVREIVGVNCGTHHDRDDNASKNIEQVGVGHIHDSKRTGGSGRPQLRQFRQPILDARILDFGLSP